MGIGIDADIHHDPKLLESLHKISIKDVIPWKISLVYKKGRNHQSIKKLCKGINKMLIGTAIRLIDGSLFSVIVNITNVSRKDKTDETKIFTFMQSDHSWTSNI